MAGYGQLIFAVVMLIINIGMRVIAWQGRPDAPPGKRHGVLTNTTDTQVPLPLVYGTRRLGINIIYQGLEGGNNAYLHVVGNLCEGEIEGIRQALVENYSIAIRADNKALVFSYNGGAAVTVNLTEGVYYAAFLAAHMQAQINKFLFCSITCIWDEVNRTYRYEAGIGNTLAFTLAGSTAASTVGFNRNHTAANSITTDVALGVGATTDLRDQVFLNDKHYTDYGTKFRYEFFRGTSSQNVCQSLKAAVPEWDAANRYTAYIYCVLEFDQDLYQSRPDIAVGVHGAKVYNPATGVTAFSNNPALCVRDFLTRSSRRGGLGIAPERIDDQSVIEAAAYCQNKGWTCDIVIKDKEAAMDNLRKLLATFRGTVIYDGSKFKIKYRDLNYEAPVMDIDESDIIESGGSSLRIAQPSIFQTPNAILMKYQNAEKRYADDEYLQADSAAIVSDGDYREREVDAPGITSTANVVKMASYFLERARINKSVSLMMGSRGMALEPEDLVVLSHHRPGWKDKLMRVIEPTITPTGEVGVMLEEEYPLMYNDIADLEAHSWHDTRLPNPASAVPSVINVRDAEEVYYYRDRSFTRWKIFFDRPPVNVYPWWDHADIYIKLGSPVADVLYFIDGEPWRGAVVSVGAGKDYATIEAAIAATPSDALFLLYPGTYGQIMPNGNYNQYFRGMGSSPEDVTYLGITLPSSSKDYIIENMTKRRSAGYAYYHFDNGYSGKFRANKIICKYNDSPNWFGYYRGLAGGAPNITVTNCQNNVNHPWMMSFNIDGIPWLDQAKNTVVRRCFFPQQEVPHNWTGGSPPLKVLDAVKKPTAGYGPEYGDYLITESKWQFMTKAKADFQLDPVQEGLRYYCKMVSVSIWGTKQPFEDGFVIARTITGLTGYPSDITGMAAIAHGDIVIVFAESLQEPDIRCYELRLGAQWAGALVVARNSMPYFYIAGMKPGTHKLWMAAQNTIGHYSRKPAMALVTIYYPPGYSVGHSWSWDYNGIGTHNNTEPVTGGFLRCAHIDGALTGTWLSPIYDMGTIKKVGCWGNFQISVTSSGEGDTWDVLFPGSAAWSSRITAATMWRELFAARDVSAGNVKARIFWGNSTGDMTAFADGFEIQSPEFTARYVRVLITITDPDILIYTRLATLQMTAVVW